MPMIEVVENPRRRHRRRHMTAKQRRYFGPRRSRRRRNPMLASIGNPRRHRRPAYRAHYRRHRTRNPKLLGMDFDFMSAAWVGVGMLGSELVPNLVRKAWAGLPSSGPMLYVVKVGGTLATAYAVKFATKSSRNFNLVMAGGLGLILVDVLRQYVLPKIGLSGLGNDASPVYQNELQDVAGYVDAPVGMSGYVESPQGAY